MASVSTFLRSRSNLFARAAASFHPPLPCRSFFSSAPRHHSVSELASATWPPAAATRIPRICASGPFSKFLAASLARSFSSSSGSLHLPAPLSQYDFAMSDATKVLADGLLAGDRFSLSRAITLIESSLEEHQKQGNALLLYVIREAKKRHLQEDFHSQQHAKPPPPNSVASSASAPSDAPQADPSSSTSASSLPAKKIRLRLGISGSPGAGKSTFIESFGCYLVSMGYRLAVLSIDPSSKRTGGSILGDKTRMAELSKSDAAYIRAWPSRGFLGGVAAATAESIVLCECARFDIVLVETVGVGQSETSVSDMCDMMLLLVNPGGGDELQGMKKGIVEVADAIIVTKADGDLLPTARNTKSDYSHAVHLLAYPDDAWRPRVSMISSVERRETGQWTSMEKVWQIVQEFHAFMSAQGRLEEKRAQQRSESLWSAVNDICVQKIHEADELRTLKAAIESQLYEGQLTPRLAANILVDEFLQHTHHQHEQQQRQAQQHTQQRSFSAAGRLSGLAQQQH